MNLVTHGSLVLGKYTFKLLEKTRQRQQMKRLSDQSYLEYKINEKDSQEKPNKSLDEFVKQNFQKIDNKGGA